MSRIDCYVDLASFYSYVAFALIEKDRERLEAHGVAVEFHPILLGAINHKTGNQPPWVLPARGKYLRYDARRSQERIGRPDIQGPRDLMTAGRTMLPNRALHYIKHNFSQHVFETTLHYLLYCFWTPPNRDLTDPAVLRQALADAPTEFRGTAESCVDSKKLFTAEEAKCIVEAAQTPQIKNLLTEATQEAVDRGAFGAPWLWVRNRAGKAEPFFGSDRFHFVYKFLGLPFEDITLLGPASETAEKSGSKL